MNNQVYVKLGKIGIVWVKKDYGKDELPSNSIVFYNGSINDKNIIGSFDMEEYGLENYFPLGNYFGNLLTIWEAKVGRAVIFAVVNGKIVKALEEVLTDSYPEYVYNDYNSDQYDILVPTWDWNIVTWDITVTNRKKIPIYVTRYRWTGKEYTIVAKTSWEDRFKPVDSLKITK